MREEEDVVRSLTAAENRAENMRRKGGHPQHSGHSSPVTGTKWIRVTQIQISQKAGRQAAEEWKRKGSEESGQCLKQIRGMGEGTVLM